ncbi:MAG: hypothetical protein VW707_08050, partial [Candidatus Puniceispirillum sp.]
MLPIRILLRLNSKERDLGARTLPFETWTLYVLTVLALMSTPGPRQLLLMSNSGVYGFRRSLITAA